MSNRLLAGYSPGNQVADSFPAYIRKHDPLTPEVEQPRTLGHVVATPYHVEHRLISKMPTLNTIYRCYRV